MAVLSSAAKKLNHILTQFPFLEQPNVLHISVRKKRDLETDKENYKNRNVDIYFY